MNRRDQTIVSDAALVERLRRSYTYSAERGLLVNRRCEVVKGSVDSRGYKKIDCRVDGRRYSVQYHRAVWAVVNGRFPTQIDHINGNPLDNRIENLREVNRSENDANRLWTWRPNARTGLPGVSAVNGVYRITLQSQVYFPDKYEAFIHLILLGRMFRNN